VNTRDSSIIRAHLRPHHALILLIGTCIARYSLSKKSILRNYKDNGMIIYMEIATSENANLSMEEG